MLNQLFPQFKPRVLQIPNKLPSSLDPDQSMLRKCKALTLTRNFVASDNEWPLKSQFPLLGKFPTSIFVEQANYL